jgi:hypothetical protein
MLSMMAFELSMRQSFACGAAGGKAIQRINIEEHHLRKNQGIFSDLWMVIYGEIL